jgi:hypothetical protein
MRGVLHEIFGRYFSHPFALRSMEVGPNFACDEWSLVVLIILLGMLGLGGLDDFDQVPLLVKTVNHIDTGVRDRNTGWARFSRAGIEFWLGSEH